MTTLLVLREQIKKFYARYGKHIVRILRFLTAFAVFQAANMTMGYMARLDSVWIALGLSVVCAFLPNGAFVVVAAVFTLIHLYAVSLEVFFVAAAAYLLFFCLYYVFQPGNSIILVLMPLMFVFRIPVAVPLVLALTSSALSAFSMSFGIIVFYMLRYVRDNAGVLSSTGSLSMPGRYTQMLNGVLGNTAMWATIAAFCVALWVVYFIRKRSFSHSWETAIAAGMIVVLLGLFMGVFLADVDLPVAEVIISTVAAGLISLVLEFFLFHLDYSRTEYVQFEDDDYYYYVKAVPKVAVTRPEVTVTKISAKQTEEEQKEESVNTTELLTAGKDLEETKVLFEQNGAPEESAGPKEAQGVNHGEAD